MPAYKGEYEDVLRPFMDGMRYKLSTNKHKGRAWDEYTLEQLLGRAQEELEELRQAVTGGNRIEVLLEACDVANFCMMIATLALKQASEGMSGSVADLNVVRPSQGDFSTWVGHHHDQV